MSSRLFSGAANAAGSALPFSFGDAVRTLHEGDSGEEVMRLQNRLKALGYLEGGADGVFDGRTRGAVEAFQRKNGIHGPTGDYEERAGRLVRRLTEVGALQGDEARDTFAGQLYAMARFSREYYAGHGPEAFYGAATGLTQAALYSDQAVPSHGTDRLDEHTVRYDPVYFLMEPGRDYDATVADGRAWLDFTVINLNPTESLAAFTVRYWADGAEGELVYAARECGYRDLNIAPGAFQTFRLECESDPALNRASAVKWAMIDVAFDNAEVCICHDLSYVNVCAIPAYTVRVK